MPINKMMHKGYRVDVGKVLGLRLRLYKMRCISILLIIMILLMLVLDSCSPSPNPVVFSPLCSENFQSANTSAKNAIVPTPATGLADDGEPIGLSEGANVFDLHRSDFQDKRQASQDWGNNPQGVIASLQNAIKRNPTDAEARIYLENWKVLTSNHPHITFVVGVSFSSSPPEGSPIDYNGSSRGILQGTFTAQKECNNQKNWGDASRTLVVLMIANIGGSTPLNSAKSAKVVANQIVDQASKDPTMLAIMGWRLSADSINVNHQLKIGGSPLPMVSSSSTSDELEGMSYFFRICPTNGEQAKIAAGFLLKTKQKKRIAILYDQENAYGNNLKEDFANSLPQSHLVSTEAYTGGDAKQIKDALAKVLAQKPDAIFFAGYVIDLTELLKDLPKDSNLLIFGGDAFASTNSYSPPIPDLHNVYFISFASPNEWDGTNPQPPFFQAYKDNFGILTVPTGLSSIDQTVMLAYDALSALLDAYQRVSSMKRTIHASDMVQALQKITGANAMQGVTGRIAFDGTGNQVSGKMIFVEHIKGTSLVIDERHGCLQKDNCTS
jgi:eukaryotic-like serine/threonine-protein kinase